MQRQECSGRDKSCKVVEAAIILRLRDPCFFILDPSPMIVLPFPLLTPSLNPSLLFVKVFHGEIVFVVTEPSRNSKFGSLIVLYRGGLIV